MAPPRAARSTSRRSTPVSPPKPSGPGAASYQPARPRSTRSQSRDVSLESGQQSAVKERRDRRVPEPVLDTVPENADVEYPEIHPSDALDAVIDLEDDEYDGFSSAHSGITSYTQYELSKLDQESMTNALPFLYQYSDSLLSLFSSGDAAQLERLRRDLQEPTSRAAKKFNALLEGFVLNRKHYGDDTPIDLEIAVRALVGLRQGDEIPDAAWRPDAVLYLANLARYISSIYGSNEESEDAREILSSMFNSFPTLFGPVFDAEAIHQEYYSSELLVNETLLVVLEIRTQHLLRQLSQMYEHPAFDPDETVRAIFYVDHDRLRGPDYMNDLSILPSTFQAIFTQRITAVRRHFSSEISNPVDFDGLRQAFPYPTFLVRLARWAEWMRKQHKDVITAYGGIGQIQSQLQHEYDRRQSGEEGNQMTRSQTILAEGQGVETSEVVRLTGGPDSTGKPTPNSPHKVKGTKKKAQPIKSLEWRAKQQQAMNQMLAKIEARKVATAAEKAQESVLLEVEAPVYDIQPAGDDGPILPSPRKTQDVHAPSQQALAVLRTLSIHAAQSNKENIDHSREHKLAFTDRQPGAEKITFDSQDEISGARERSSTKRKAPDTHDEENEDEDEDEDEDDDFEVDHRSAHPVPRRQVPTQSQRIGEDSRTSKAATNERMSRGSPSKRARLKHTHRDAMNEEEDEEEEEEDEEDDDEDNVAASSQLRQEQANSNRHRSASSNPPRRRQPLHERHNIPPSSSAPTRGSSAALPAGTQVTVVNQRARQNTVRRLAKARPHQQRSRWTEEEVERLVELIEDYGVSWANLLRLDHDYPDGPKLLQRDQVGLKDKARNMKMDFLKAGAELPFNFEHIALGNRLIGMLDAQGVTHNER